MNIRKNARKSTCILFGLLPLSMIVGCGSDAGVDPNIKVQQDKSVEDSVAKSRSGAPGKEAAPVQRTKAAPG